MAPSFFFNADDDDEPQEYKPCDQPGCTESGLYPAPKSRHNLREYYFFCLTHVREYNKKWDFFAGFTQEQIYEHMRADTAWDRPTWPMGEAVKIEEKLQDFIHKFTGDKPSAKPAPAPVLSKEAQAFNTLGLEPDASAIAVKSRYRELVKRYHPDMNPDNPKAVERFRVISEAYTIIRASFQGGVVK